MMTKQKNPLVFWKGLFLKEIWNTRLIYLSNATGVQKFHQIMSTPLISIQLQRSLMSTCWQGTQKGRKQNLRMRLAISVNRDSTTKWETTFIYHITAVLNVCSPPVWLTERCLSLQTHVFTPCSLKTMKVSKTFTTFNPSIIMCRNEWWWCCDMHIT